MFVAAVAAMVLGQASVSAADSTPAILKSVKAKQSLTGSQMKKVKGQWFNPYYYNYAYNYNYGYNYGYAYPYLYNYNYKYPYLYNYGYNYANYPYAYNYGLYNYGLYNGGYCWR